MWKRREPGRSRRKKKEEGMGLDGNRKGERQREDKDMGAKRGESRSNNRGD